MIRFLSSMKNAIYFFLLAIAFLFIGVQIIPGAMQTYTGILDELLSRWLMETGLGVSWWILGLVGSMMLIGLSTLLSSMLALAGLHRAGRLSLRTISPHLIHLGVLLMLLGHLAGSLTGVRAEALVKQGGVMDISEGTGFLVESIRLPESAGEQGVWQVSGHWTEEGIPVRPATIKPASPSYYKGLWLFIKTVEGGPMRTVLMARGGIGVLLLFAGGIVFLSGCVANLRARMGQSLLPGMETRPLSPQCIRDLEARGLVSGTMTDG